MRIGAVATVAGTSAPKARMEMSDATVKLMDITSDMSSALQVGADDGQVMQRNGKRNGRMEDLIKRSDAIEAIKGNSYLYDDYIEINGYGAIEDIRTLPSADRPSGEWVDAGTDLDGTHYYRCSHCGWEVDTDYPNCPYCTAKMKGAGDENKD